LKLLVTGLDVTGSFRSLSRDSAQNPCCCCCDCRDNPPKYSPIRYGTHLEGKVLTNFEMDEAAEM
jgi:hypothetical protein